MKAAWYERFGAAADVLTVGEQKDPRPGPGEVLVRLHSSAPGRFPVCWTTGT